MKNTPARHQKLIFRFIVSLLLIISLLWGLTAELLKEERKKTQELELQLQQTTQQIKNPVQY